MSTHKYPDLVFNIILREMADFRTGTLSIQREPGERKVLLKKISQ